MQAVSTHMGPCAAPDPYRCSKAFEQSLKYAVFDQRGMAIG